MAEVALKDLEFLSDGHLANLADWTEDVAKEIASREGLTLIEDHWKVVNLLRDFYRDFHISPVQKLLLKTAKKSLGDQFDADYMNLLFPDGVGHQGSKVAGVPEPHLDAELENKTYTAKASFDSTSKRFVGEFEYNGAKLKVTEKGNLVDPSIWDKDLANFLADHEGIKLTDDHWEVINFMRKFYFEYGVTPMVFMLMKHLKDDLGEEKASKEHLYTLFPEGPSRQGSRIAGLGEPQGCIDP
ncbi:MAG: TusE/DsrC/DsvC family sulfur relay protein [Methylococcales bacterium]|jgi:tRNA 2-thiouridine synthesizing protein E|nr:TusE/DsrC/DsvC family sulfur relay protein [Methylococcales bacterium]MBT7443009.1 TusE/DsrC/DsvC family sulfur relay protein [Methylococcales bacterium]